MGGKPTRVVSRAFRRGYAFLNAKGTQRGHIESRSEGLLFALIEYAEKSGTFNPRFYLSEMLSRLGVDEGTFNILRYSLGERYCWFVDVHKDEPRYAINVAECLNLRDSLEREARDERRHGQAIRVAGSPPYWGLFSVLDSHCGLPTASAAKSDIWTRLLIASCRLICDAIASSFGPDRRGARPTL